MTEEKTVLENETGTVVDNTDYITAIKELKENSVDRAKYDQLRSENKRLLDSIVNGRELEQSVDKGDKRTIQELRKEIFDCANGGKINLEVAQAIVDLRKELIESGHDDPCCPSGTKTIATEEDKAAAQRVIDVFEQCIEYAEGDNFVFTNELMRRTNDVNFGSPKKRR